jgi:hypothetical protein
MTVTLHDSLLLPVLSSPIVGLDEITTREESMKPGRFRLTRPTIGVSVDGPRTKCMVVPANEVIEVTMPNSLSPRRTTTVKWRDIVLRMFTEDVVTRVVAFTESN